MGAPKGHAPYPGCEKGGALGYLGAPESIYTQELLEELGKGLVEWIQQKGNIWCNGYFCTKGILKDTVRRLGERNPKFKEYLDTAKQIQEHKLLSEPYYKKADGNHARWMLARHHKGDWEDKPMVIQEKDEENISKSMEAVNFLQSKAKAGEDVNGQS
jgi:hypothetical protein